MARRKLSIGRRLDEFFRPIDTFALKYKDETKIDASVQPAFQIYFVPNAWSSSKQMSWNSVTIPNRNIPEKPRKEAHYLK